MATFDDKNAFVGGPSTTKKKSKTTTNKDVEAKAIKEISKELDKNEVAQPVVEKNQVSKGTNKVIAEEHVETAKEKKLRLQKEKAELKRKEKEREAMIKAHHKALRKKPESIKRYDTDIENGLSSEVVEERQLDNLVNTARKGSTKSIKKIVFSNIFTFFNMVTIFIAGWLISVRAFTDLVFLVIVSANIVIGIYQEIKAKKAIDKLSLISAPSAVVVRDGETKEINVEEIVLDDLICLGSGNQICADSIVVSGSVEVNESLLTGESDAIVKKPGDLLFSGSFVVSGKCRARVDKVGKENYIEKLANQAKKYQKPKSDLLKSLNWIIIVMAVLIIPIGATLFYLQYFSSGVDYVTAVRKTAGAMIGMIPSGLWLLTSVALFVGIVKLAQRNVLVQELYCIEMLARVNVLCLDKTGTITDGTMSVKNVIDYNNIYGLTTKNVVSAMLNALNESNLTSKALEEKFGLNKRIKYSATIPFSSQRKLNAVTFDKLGTFALGAPEFVLKDQYVNVQKEVEKYAKMGYRILSLAHFNGSIQNNNLPNSTPELVSLILIEDNIRPDAIETIEYFKNSGVSVRVISGDNPLTVAKISERAGIENADQYISLDGLSDDEVERAASRYTVFGRVSPSQKRLLIDTLKKAGNTVAMTGDGVNDILALKEADCSIAIASGSDAARNVSHLVLLDSNFGSMPKVVSEGRRVINNVTALAALYLTKTIFSLLLASYAILSGGTYPISTNQLFMIDFLAIGLPSFILAQEPNNREVQGKFLVNVIKGALPGALTILIISIAVFLLADSLSLDTISLQTIIVIAATHTCMMVLFRACKPFTILRKALCIFCYTAAVLIAFLMPQFLELRPLIKVSEYYSPNINQDVMTFCPQIEISDDYYYVINGKVINYQRVSSEKNINISSIYDNGKAYYTFNGTNVYEEVIIPNLSYIENGDIILGGFEVFVEEANVKYPIVYSEDYTNLFSIDDKGYLYYESTINGETDKRPVMQTLTTTNEYYNFYNKYGANKTLDVHVCIMPQVELKNNQLVVTPVVSSDSTNSTTTTYKTTLSSSDIIDLKINLSTMELLVNGKVLYNVYDDDTRSENYRVSFPTISINSENEVIVNGVDTKVTVSKFDIEAIFTADGIVDTSNIKVLPFDASYYIVDNDIIQATPASGFNTNVRLSNPLICPDVYTTESGHYIIDGYYTEFLSVDASMEAKFDSEYNLIIGNVVTDYKIPSSTISTTTGGMVSTLPIQGIIFLIMLCLLSIPVMNIFSGIIPWIKRQILYFQKLISKI